jgi:phage FluMu protein Com
MKQNVMPNYDLDSLPEVRCPHCHRLLFKGSVILIEIKCPKCHHCYSVDYSNRKKYSAPLIYKGDED